MIHHIPNVLSKEQVAEFRQLMATANWVGGKVTAGTLSASVKQNQQLSENDPLTHHLSELVIQAIWKNPVFQAAALPHQIIPPLFNRYDEHESFGFQRSEVSSAWCLGVPWPPRNLQSQWIAWVSSLQALWRAGGVHREQPSTRAVRGDGKYHPWSPALYVLHLQSH